MPKTIEITAYYDPDCDNKEEFDREFYALANAPLLYSELEGIRDILLKYDKKKDLSKIEKKLLGDIRNKVAKHLKLVR